MMMEDLMLEDIIVDGTSEGIPKDGLPMRMLITLPVLYKKWTRLGTLL